MKYIVIFLFFLISQKALSQNEAIHFNQAKALGFNFSDSLSEGDIVTKSDSINQMEEMITYIFSKNDYDLAYELRLLSLKIGQKDCLILEDDLARYLRIYDDKRYLYFEAEFNRFYLDYVQNFSPDINLDLSLKLQKMIRLDQRTKFDAENCKYPLKKDSLWEIARVQDGLNEVVFLEILKEYGYPGKSLVGYQNMSIGYLLMLHMSTDFQIKYVYLLEKAIEEKELYSNIEFLIDKILYKCCKKSIYGNWNKNGLAELVTSKDEILDLKRKLNLRIE
jgi:hypothetical protein